MKTPEELAEECVEQETTGNETYEHGLRNGFLAGYEACEKQQRIKTAEMYSHGSEVQQIAAQYVKQRGITGAMAAYAENRFIDGYQAAKDQFADGSKVMNSPEKLDSWISVKERLPEFDVWCVWWSFDKRCENGIARREYGDSMDWWSDYDYWFPLPEPPKEEK